MTFHAGLARTVGADVCYLAHGCEVQLDLSSGHSVELPAEDRESLARETSLFAPTEILSSERLRAKTLAALRESAPGARLLTIPDWRSGGSDPLVGDRPEDLADRRLTTWGALTVIPELVPFAWMCQPGPDGAPAPRFLLDVTPDYDARLMNATARDHRPFIRILGGDHCTSRIPLSDSPFLEGICVAFTLGKEGQRLRLFLLPADCAAMAFVAFPHVMLSHQGATPEPTTLRGPQRLGLLIERLISTAPPAASS